MKNLLLHFLLVGLTFTACDTHKKTTTTNTSTNTTPPADPLGSVDAKMKVSFYNSDNFVEAMKRAKSQNKTLFVDFYTTWCAPCKVMEQSVFIDEDVADYVNQNCISIRVNAEKGNGPTLKLENAVDAYPTMLVFNNNGDEIARKQGSLGIEDFKKFIKAAVWKAKNPTN